MKHKHRGNRRLMTLKKSRRKERIVKALHTVTSDDYRPEFKHDEMTRYDKIKIHCSCPLCAAKTKKAWGKRSRGLYSWKHTDRKKLIALYNDYRESVEDVS